MTWNCRLLQQSCLPKDCGLVPVEPFSRDLVTAKSNNYHVAKLNPPVGGRHTGQNPIHLLVVIERKANLIDDMSLTDVRHLPVTSTTCSMLFILTTTPLLASTTSYLIFAKCNFRWQLAQTVAILPERLSLHSLPCPS